MLALLACLLPALRCARGFSFKPTAAASRHSINIIKVVEVEVEVEVVRVRWLADYD